MKYFDLNIKEILENRETYHAIREIIANALDEQTITNTENVEIYKDGKWVWHIRDFWRWIKEIHLIQNENNEKTTNNKVVGKFWVWLKDALAVFDRHNIEIHIKSKYNIIKLTKIEKNWFKGIKTLHATIEEPDDTEFMWTDFLIKGIQDEEIGKAKNMFLLFSWENVLEKTFYWDIIEKKWNLSYIYLNGVRIAEEHNFLFSYNITLPNEAIRKELNRERNNVWRQAYSERVKQIVLSSKNEKVIEILSNDLKIYSIWNHHDELSRIDVQQHAIKLLNTLQKVVFVTNDQTREWIDIINEAEKKWFEVITIPNHLKERIEGIKDFNDNPVTNLNQYLKEKQENYEFKYINYEELNLNEKKVYDQLENIIKIFWWKPHNLNDIKISENMQKNIEDFSESMWIFDHSKWLIIIRRDQLYSAENFFSIVCHELAHAYSLEWDCTRWFEAKLCWMIGKLCNLIFKDKKVGEKMYQEEKMNKLLDELVAVSNKLLRRWWEDYQQHPEYIEIKQKIKEAGQSD